MDKFKNKYRIASARAPFWDYGGFGAYFVTICTQNRICWFGDVVHEKMELSDIGEIAQSEWLKTFEMRPDMNLWMGEYVVMPDHFHAIIGIGYNEYNTQINTQTDTQTDTQRRDAMHCVSANPAPPTNPNTTTDANNRRPKNQFGPQSKNLASIIRGFKIGVTKNARQINTDFTWQSRYHDHIIRNESSYRRISEYIKNNPLQWSKDTSYTP